MYRKWIIATRFHSSASILTNLSEMLQTVSQMPVYSSTWQQRRAHITKMELLARTFGEISRLRIGVSSNSSCVRSIVMVLLLLMMLVVGIATSSSSPWEGEFILQRLTEWMPICWVAWWWNDYKAPDLWLRGRGFDFRPVFEKMSATGTQINISNYVILG